MTGITRFMFRKLSDSRNTHLLENFYNLENSVIYDLKKFQLWISMDDFFRKLVLNLAPYIVIPSHKKVFKFFISFYAR